MSTSTATLPQLGDDVFLTDSGLETDLVFHHGFELPHFAAFVLLDDAAGTEALRRYYQDHIDIARAQGCGLVLESCTWRANPDWAERLGIDAARLDALNHRAIALLTELRDGQAEGGPAVVVSGCIGPRGDGYQPSELMTAEEAQRYHDTQIATFAATDPDLVTAMTITHPAEAIGVTRAAQTHGIPVVISFTVETNGLLPDGTSLPDAIRAVDEATGGAPASYMVNCAHPSHFGDILEPGAGWTRRIRGIRANASRMSHAELDEAEELDDGDPQELADDYRRIRERLPHITVLGGCCGTDSRHVAAIARACVPTPS